jgi:hypothetical protein
MKKIILILAFIFVSLSSTYAQTRKLGVGALLGDPTALSAKYFMGTNAVDGGVAFGNHEFILFGDYLKHFPGKIGNQNAFVAALTPYVGIGAVIAFDDGENNHSHHHFINDDEDDFALGARIPFGVEWMATEIPMGVALEIVPGIVVVPETDAFVQGGLAVRYYFN